MAATREPRPTPGALQVGGVHVPLVVRYVLGGVGVLGLVLGALAVFATLNGAGSFALVIGGVILVLAALGQVPGVRSDAAAPQASRGSDALITLLGSADAAVRMAAAEAVLGHRETDRPALTGEPRELALNVLLERDLVRRLADLLRRGGYAVESDGAAPGAATLGADLVVRVTRSDGVSAVPVAVSTGAGADDQQLVQQVGAVAGRLHARSAIALFTGHQPGDVPLGHVTTVGAVRVATVYSPQLSDEHAIVAAVSEAGQLPAGDQSASGSAGRPMQSSAS